MTPPFHQSDFDTRSIGIDETHLRFGEVSVDTCRACGAMWLRYSVEYEAFTESGRWFRGLVSPEEVRSLTPERAETVLQGLAWHFRGGSYFRTSGERSTDLPRIDL